MALEAEGPGTIFVLPRKALLFTCFAWLILILSLEGVAFLVSAWVCEWGLQTAVARNFQTVIKNSSVELQWGASRMLLLSDMHVLGYRQRIAADIVWSDWGLFKALFAASLLHRPDLVVVNGDVFDEAHICSDEELSRSLARFQRMMRVVGAEQPGGIVPLMVTVGNHDVGLGSHVTQSQLDRIEIGVGPAGWVRCWRNMSFVGYNTQVLPPDANWTLREEALAVIKSNETQRSIHECGGGAPIVIQHMPLFRESDASCGDEIDACKGPASGEGAATPAYCRVTHAGVTYKARHDRLMVWHDDIMDKETSEMLLKHLKPAVVLSGHTHAPCVRAHPIPGTARIMEEITLPTFAWRMRPDAGYAIADLSPGVGGAAPSLQLQWCGLPDEHAVIHTYIAAIVATLTGWIFWLFRLRKRQECPARASGPDVMDKVD